MKKSIKSIFCLLLFIVLACSACGRAKFENGFAYPIGEVHLINLAVTSDTDTFDKSEVAFELYYGLHDMDYDEKHGSEPQSHYLVYDGYEKVRFGLYLFSGNAFNALHNGENVSDFKHIENLHFVREISQEEAFSEEYGYRMSFWRGKEFYHHEEIAIPAEFFTQEQGAFYAVVIAFLEPAEGELLSVEYNHVRFSYQTAGDNHVKIIF